MLGPVADAARRQGSLGSRSTIRERIGLLSRGLKVRVHPGTRSNPAVREERASLDPFAATPAATSRKAASPEGLRAAAAVLARAAMRDTGAVQGRRVGLEALGARR